MRRNFSGDSSDSNSEFFYGSSDSSDSGDESSIRTRFSRVRTVEKNVKRDIHGIMCRYKRNPVNVVVK